MTTICGVCGREFDDMESSAHEHDAGGTSEATALACMVCGESFRREEELVRHQAIDHVGVDLPDEEQAVP